MSGQGNVRLKGAKRVNSLGNEISSSGAVLSVARTGVGEYEWTMDGDYSLAVGDVVKVTPEWDAAVTCSVERLSQTRFDVHMSTVAAVPAPVDAGHGVRITTINRG